MKAAVIEGPGQAPRFADFAEPMVGEGRELVELVAAGIHPVVRSLAAGTHYGSGEGRWPLVPGVDAVARTAGGRLVYTGFVTPPWGTLAERMAVPAQHFDLPAGADPVQVAGGVNPGMSSWLPLQARIAALGARPLGTVLISGATGVAGGLAVQNALALGASRVIGAGRDAGRLERVAALGATPVRFTGDRAADAAAVTAALEGDAPSLVLDFVWGAPAEAVFAALARQGLDEDDADIAYVQVGSLAGAEATLPASLLRARKITVTGSGAGSASMAEIMRQLPVYLQRLADGTVSVAAQAFPLRDVEQAWATGSDVRAVVTM